MRRLKPSPRPGFTLAEMMIAITLMLLVFAVAVPFVRAQARAVENVSGRSEARQNVRYAVSAIDRDLRVAGVGVVETQPMIVLAAPRAITFNADLITRDDADVSAVYLDRDADPASVGVMARTNQVTLPGTDVTYPESTYTQSLGGAPSRAETISYWVERDATASRNDQYTLFRRVNATPAQVVVRGILLGSSEPVFRYLTKNADGVVTEVPATQLPLIHRIAVHGSADDANQPIDQIIAVRVKLTGLYRDMGTQGDSARSVESTIRIVNAGLMRAAVCGVQPRSGAGVDARYLAAPTPRVQVSWTPSADETGGERDVERYAVYRRAPSESAWGEPIGSTAAGLSTYTFVDNTVRSGDVWIYGVAAQDCTPLNSPISAAPTVAVP